MANKVGIAVIAKWISSMIGPRAYDYSGDNKIVNSAICIERLNTYRSRKRAKDDTIDNFIGRTKYTKAQVLFVRKELLREEERWLSRYESFMGLPTLCALIAAICAMLSLMMQLATTFFDFMQQSGSSPDGWVMVAAMLFLTGFFGLVMVAVCVYERVMFFVMSKIGRISNIVDLRIKIDQWLFDQR